MKKQLAVICLLLCACLLFCTVGCTDKSDKNEISESKDIQSEVASVDRSAIKTYIETKTADGIVIETQYFALTLPTTWEDNYMIQFNDQDGYSLRFADLISYNQQGHGGHIFTLDVWPEDSISLEDFRGGMATLIGKLTLPDKSVYNVTVMLPSDVQAVESRYEAYDQMASQVDGILATFTAMGEGTSYEAVANHQQSQETVMPAAYDEILQKIISAYPWSNSEPVIPGLPEASYMYFLYSNLSDVGYSLQDVDGNGVPELLIGEEYTIVDAYTLKNNQAVHLFDGGERYRYSLCSDGSFLNKGSSSAYTSNYNHYVIDPDGNDIVLTKMVILDNWHAVDIGLIDSPESETAFWFTSTTENPEDYVQISREEAEHQIDAWEEKTVEINYTPLSEYK